MIKVNSQPITKFFYGEYNDTSLFYTEKVASRYIGGMLNLNNDYNIELSTEDFNLFIGDSNNSYTFDFLKNKIKNNTILFYRNPFNKLLSGLGQDLFIFLYKKPHNHYELHHYSLFWEIFDSKIEKDIFLNYIQKFDIENINYTFIYSEILNDYLTIDSYKISDIFKKICTAWIKYFVEYFPINYNHSSFWCYSVNELMDLLKNENTKILLCDIDKCNTDTISSLFNRKDDSNPESSNILVKNIFLNIIKKDDRLLSKIEILLRLENFYYNKLTRLQNNIIN